MYDVNTMFEQCREKANDNIFDFLVYVFEALERETGHESECLRQFAEQYSKKLSFKKETDPVTVSKDQLVRLFSKYGNLVQGYIDYLVEERLEEPVFYHRLWRFMNNRDIFPDSLASKVAFMWVTKNAKIPYFYLPERVLMENEDYRTYFKQVDLQRQKLVFALKCDYTQRTERASVIWSVLNEVTDENARIVLLASLLKFVEDQKNEEDD